MDNRRNVGFELSLWVVGVGAFLVLAGMCIWSYQGFLYLADGVWTELPLWKILSAFDENILDGLQEEWSWKGLQKVIIWIVDQSAALVLICIGGILLWIRTAGDY